MRAATGASRGHYVVIHAHAHFDRAHVHESLDVHVHVRAQVHARVHIHVHAHTPFRGDTQEYKCPSRRASKKNCNSVVEALQTTFLDTRLKSV